jgi:lipoprotein-anchoring transpeptidase ErfK/SrfK
MVNDKEHQAQKALRKARAALRNGDKKAAYAWAKHAAKLTPQKEDPWLILAAASKPETSIKFLQRALRINPSSGRAKQGMAWAQKKLAEQGKRVRVTRVTAQKARPREKQKKTLPLLFFGALLLICLVAGVFLTFNPTPVKALLGEAPTATATVLAQHWAQGTIAKPTYTPSATPTFTASPTATQTPSPTSTQTPTPTFTPTQTNTPRPTHTLNPTPTAPPPPTAPIPTEGEEHWIEVNLSQQRLYAYAGNTLIRSFVVSTGLPQTPTVTGRFHVYLKYVSTTMTGPGYYLTNVPYTMYFHGSYGIHGTYWHNNFGTPMSHGCVNMRSDEAHWLYDFSPLGTLVYVHY